ncbi:MAG: NAD(P)/FAD-dependent oxidoreductase [Pseudomonadota bacterium]
MSAALADVFSPFAIGGVTFRNRIFLPAHTTNFARDFLPTAENVAYLRERARGGVALVIVEPLRVHRTSLGRSGGLSGGDRRALPGLQAMVEAIKGEGARAFVQITHAGRHGENAVDRLPAWGPSAVPWVAGGEMPHAMTRREMDDVREAYVETAHLAVEAGFEGMEIHLGHGHLLHQFLSPAANVRDDAYGGSLDNRMRYPLEVLRAVTEAVGDTVLVGVRMSVDDLMDDGVPPHEHRTLAARAVGVPGVAFVNASVAAYQWPSIGHHVADMSAPAHPYLDLTQELRAVIGEVPLFTANRYRTLTDAQRALATGAIQMVGMNRAHMADPSLIAKTKAGRAGDVRPCVANNYCIGQIALHRPIACMMNPRVGKEEAWPEEPPISSAPQRVLVVGGGPAGMEAARVAALAGHAVTVWERSATLGGRLGVAGTGHGRGDLHTMRAYLLGQLQASGATVETGVDATPDTIAAFGADAVILAVGAVADPLPFGDMTTVDAALAEPRTIWDGATVVLVDDAGSWASLTAAETLVHEGAEVTVISRPDGPLWDVTIYSRMTALERLAALGVALRPGLIAVSREADGLVCRHKYTGETMRYGPFDRLIHVGRGTGAHALQSALEDRGLAVHVIGDALAPRTLFEAMHDANAAARGLDAR